MIQESERIAVLGSASLELDEDGLVISYEEYHPYGTTAYHAAASGVEVSAKRYRYTGKERDEETGLYYHGARYYASWLGRWTSADPAGMVDGSNLYSYVVGNPIRLTDPDGQQSNIPSTSTDEQIMQMTDGQLHAHLKPLSRGSQESFASSATGAFANRAWAMLKILSNGASGENASTASSALSSPERDQLDAGDPLEEMEESAADLENWWGEGDAKKPGLTNEDVSVFELIGPILQYTFSGSPLSDFSDWNLPQPNVRDLGSRAVECLGGLCHARHPNFYKNEKKVTNRASRPSEGQSWSTSGNGGRSPSSSGPVKVPEQPKPSAPGNQPKVTPGGVPPRSPHSVLRGAQGRRVGPVFNDARKARPSEVFRQADGRYVLRGPKGREHIFEANGEHITTVDRTNRAHLQRLRDDKIRPVNGDEFDEFMRLFQ